MIVTVYDFNCLFDVFGFSIKTVITNFETENKYRVKNSLGQQIYFAHERE